MSRKHFYATLMLVAAPLLACSSHGANDGSSEAASTSGGAKAKTPAGPTSLRWPAPSTTDNPLDVTAVVDRWKTVQDTFYKAPYKGYTVKPAGFPTPGFEDEFRDGGCLDACPENFSDIVCHFYCWHPSYESVVPNVRGCFTNISRGVDTGKKGMFYPESYDYCAYQAYDPVLNPDNDEPDPTDPGDLPRGKAPGRFLSKNLDYNQATIDKNKAAGNFVGVLGNSHLRAGEQIFKYVMFTWYDPFLFNVADQQKAINEFYGVKLKDPNYVDDSKGDMTTCKNSKRPPTASDANLAEGMHCSAKKDYKKVHRRLDDPSTDPWAADPSKTKYQAAVELMNSGASAVK